MNPASGSGRKSLGDALPMCDFGVELAMLRTRRGWSVAELARQANISEGHICNLESGRRNPKPAVAAACDAALDAGGVLIERVEADDRGAGADIPVEASVLIAGYGQVLESLKDIGRHTGPRFVAAALRSNTRTLTDASALAVGGQRLDIWRLASRFAEYAGWMAQESGNSAEAWRWTELAVQWGAAGGDDTVAAYAQVRKASIAEHRGDVGAAIGFAVQAGQHKAATPMIRAHAARREAQGYARRGDYGACREALARSRSYAKKVSPCGEPQWGPRIESGNRRLIEASCLVSLRRFEQAADLFAGERGRRPAVPADSNSCARFALRHAVAMAGIDQLDAACQVVAETLPTVKQLDSASVRAELGRFVNEGRSRRATAAQDALITTAYMVARGM